MECENLVERVGLAISAGVTMVQLRLKMLSDREVMQIGRQLRTISREAGIPLIVNDRLDIACALNADGIHLGVDDLPVAEARRLAGPDFIIGFSPETDDEIAQAASEGADYLGIGPFFTTTTKGDAGTPLGAAEFRRRRWLTDLPVVAIGGIDAPHAAQPIAASADGVAVASAILAATDVGRATRLLRDAVDQ
jgi:thiamine-phosphate pyrophosphorylase